MDDSYKSYRWKNLLDQLVIDNNRVLDILAKSTGKKIAQIRKDFNRKAFFNAAKALKYNLIDKVIQQHRGSK